ncbi:MAG: insulinase family protein [Holosporales bacterium]|nr:insulinase family protein [Holosporales bacterium]
MRRIYLFAVLLVTLTFELFSVNAKIQSKTLGNGLRVIVVPLKTKDVISFGVGYFVGSADDPRCVVGISHLLEHMMFKGTTNLSGDKLKDLVFIYNKDSNAFTSFDVTFFEHLCNKSLMDIDLKIEADRMQNLALTDESVESEKQVVIEERKMTEESNPIIKYMREAVWKMTYLYSAYSYPIVGYEDQIRACDKDILQVHYGRWYVPNNAFVLFVGDITIDEAVTVVQKHFGHIPKKPDPERNRVVDPEETGLRYSVDRGSDQISVHNLNIIYKIDKELFDNVRKLVTMEIVVDILAGGMGSVLYEEMVDKRELAYTLDSQTDIRAFDKGRVNIATVFRENQNVDEVDKTISSIVAAFHKKYLTKERFEKVKQKYLDQFQMLNGDPKAMTMFIIENYANGQKLEELDDIENIVSNVTFEEVVEVATKIFDKENRIMRIYSHPKEQ